MSELELKLRVPDAALASLRSALRAHGAKTVRLQARYFDTADGRLARNHVALRLRHEGRRWTQAAKAAGEGAVHRLEHEVQLTGADARAPAIDPHRHDGSDVAGALAAALEATPVAALADRHAVTFTPTFILLDESGQKQEEFLYAFNRSRVLYWLNQRTRA